MAVLTTDRLDHAGRLALAGAFAGLLAIGLGSRLAMRLVALTSGHIGNMAIRPESGAIPGTVTVSGTSFLLLAGTVVGMALGLGILSGCGRWMSTDPRRRWWTTVALASAVPAIGLLDPHNPDFRLFGPTWLAIGLFTALPLAYGALLATWAPGLVRWQGGRVARTVRIVAGGGGVATTALAAVGLGASDAPGLLALPVLVLAGVLAGPTAGTDPTGRVASAGRRGVVVLTVVAAGVTTWRALALVLA